MMSGMNLLILAGLVGLTFGGPRIDLPDSKTLDNKILRFQKMEPMEAHWISYKQKYNKFYNDEEDERHYKIFQACVKRVEMHNYLASKGEKSFTMEINHFCDIEPEKFFKTRNGLLPRNHSKPDNIDPATYMSPLVKLDLPKSVDWRKKGYVTPVKDQGACGSCWAFSATGSLEGQHFRKTGKLVSLSEQNLVDCSTDNDGCEGGLMDRAFKYVNDNDGIDTEKSYPYQAEDLKCRFKTVNIGATDLGFTDIKSGDEQALKEAVATIGPISIGIDANHHSFMHYSSGVYMEPQCNPKNIDHGVLIVGYGTDEKSGHDYWIVKNSWGKVWGMDGYVLMARNQNNQCGVASTASYPIV